MKRVLITGANSYVGTNVEKWLMKEPDKYYVETLDMKNPNWKDFDFSGFDVVFHVAGIAHVSAKKRMKEIYFKINRDLAIETALKSKESGVDQFIFMSSMIIYGENNRLNDNLPVDTSLFRPDNFYGHSKLEADIAIQNLNCPTFKVIIIRTPIIYGYGCKGNLPKLIKFSQYTCIIPKINNKKSMLYIDYLSESIEKYITQNMSGIFYPQNPEYVSTNEIIKITRKYNMKRTRESLLLAVVIRIFYFTKFMRKIYGNKYFKLSMQLYTKVVSFEQTIINTIRGYEDEKNNYN